MQFQEKIELFVKNVTDDSKRWGESVESDEFQILNKLSQFELHLQNKETNQDLFLNCFEILEEIVKKNPDKEKQKFIKKVKKLASKTKFFSLKEVILKGIKKEDENFEKCHNVLSLLLNYLIFYGEDNDFWNELNNKINELNFLEIKKKSHEHESKNEKDDMLENDEPQPQKKQNEKSNLFCCCCPFWKKKIKPNNEHETEQSLLEDTKTKK